MLIKITRSTFLVAIVLELYFMQFMLAVPTLENETKKSETESKKIIYSESGSILDKLNSQTEAPTNFSLIQRQRSADIFEQYAGELCNRECLNGDQRICYFKFTLEHYQAMGVACGDCDEGVESDCFKSQCITGDGFEKGVMSINRQIPGPAIQVCRGDLLVIDVVNLSGGTAATLHWHGLHMRETPWMDGVPFVTQCPIDFSTTFRYQYWATEAGTQFYHSHSGHHKINGQYGALIIRQPIKDEKHANNYDYDLPEHYILVSDWMHRYGEDLFPGLPSVGGIYPDSVLINGRGSYIIPKTGERKSVPPTRYYVQSAKKYRFRLINSISSACPIQLQIENHNMSIIASDSFNLVPHMITTLVSNAGERYDFVLETNQPPGDYWIRVRGLGVCEITDSLALLRYVDNTANVNSDDVQRMPPTMPDFEEIYPAGVMLNHPDTDCFSANGDYCITELQALDEDIPLLLAEPDYRFYLAFNNYVVPNSDIFRQGGYHHFLNIRHNLTLISAINQLSLIFPPSPPLTQPDDIDSSMICDEFNRPSHCTDGKICPCVHRLYVRTGSIVELIVVDENEVPGGMVHPFHLHGFAFLVTAQEKPINNKHYTVQGVKKLDMQRSLRRGNFNMRAPWKDTVSVPSYGYAILRFRADNPGYWLLHCHYEWHVAVGMGLIVQVGDDNEMVPPPEGFPKCGNFIPDMLSLT